MKKLLFIFLLFSISFVSNAQYSRRLQPLYDTEGGYFYPRGLHFAPGITYMLPGDWNQDLNSIVGVDSLLTGEKKARGKIGLYLEVGHAHFLPDWMPFEFIDYGISFKMLRGKEDINASINHSETGDLLGEFETQQDFSESFLAAYLNFGKFFQLTDYSFISLSAGVNADYRIISNRNVDGPVYFQQLFPEDLFVQAHVKLGYGYKLQENLFFMPSLETPFLNLLPFDKGKSTLPYFSSRYRPIILSLRFQWLTRKKPEDCVGKPSKPTGHQLWDPKMKRK